MVNLSIIQFKVQQFLMKTQKGIAPFECIDSRKDRATLVTFLAPPNYKSSFLIPDTYNLRTIETDFFQPAYEKLKRAIDEDNPDGVHNS